MRQFKEKYSFKKLTKHEFQHFSLKEYIVTAFKVYIIVKYYYTLFFIDTIAFTFNKSI